MGSRFNGRHVPGRNGRPAIPAGGKIIDVDKKGETAEAAFLKGVRAAKIMIDADEKEVSDLLEGGPILEDAEADDKLRGYLAEYAAQLKGCREALRPIHARALAFAASEKVAEHNQRLNDLVKPLDKADADSKKLTP